MSRSVWPDAEDIRSCKANCLNCAFSYRCNKGKTEYCTLKRFPILNPEIGCSQHMYSSEFSSMKPEEKEAHKEAKKLGGKR